MMDAGRVMGSIGPTPPTAATTTSTTGSREATPAATSVLTTPFDGVWATPQLTIDQLRAAVQANGMDPTRLDEVVGPNPGFSDHVVFEVQIRRGRWVEHEVDNGVPSGVR
jgi:hypothetical protein